MACSWYPNQTGQERVLRSSKQDRAEEKRGYLVRILGIQPDQEKIEKLTSWDDRLREKNYGQQWAYGHTSYYSFQITHNCSTTVAAIRRRENQAKNVKIDRTPECERTVNEIKLQLPVELPWLHTDAWESGFAVILIQVRNDVMQWRTTCRIATR